MSTVESTDEELEGQLQRFNKFEESMDPEERLQEHLLTLENVRNTRTVSGNLETYMIGTIFFRFMEQPSYYVPEGEEPPSTAKEVADRIGVNSAHITRGKELVEFYSLEEMRKFAVLPQICLRSATELNPRAAKELLEDLLERKRKGELGRGEATKAIEEKVEEVKQLSEAGDDEEEDEEEEDDEPDSLEPPVDDLERAADRVMDVADDILENEGYYLFTQEHRANIEGVFFGLKDRLDDLKKMIDQQKEDLDSDG